MRVFVLNTGRCGSVTLARACEELTNYTVGHESRARRVGDDRLDYPDQHIEIDNRLSWFLGELDERYGAEPLYVHLRRDPLQVARSFARRWENGNPAGVINAFAGALVIRPQPWPGEQRLEVCRFYVRTVTANIEAFLADKPHQMTVWLDEAEEWFPQLWERIGGEGDADAALKRFEVQHNAS
ncbi:hypothetical protein [Streptomonospora litoralis]|uniref:Sulfotransferase family protein n=1 Tax=Streptomonospora litoralis TaxID=2498135 RepID=A0A4P6PZG9_9ACTN|nr:hypothetical protein [Streptomonospora litoralis]QBI53706.1 hypothetical protein EKD16_09590 [Streptomonospora litoralis]